MVTFSATAPANLIADYNLAVRDHQGTQRAVANAMRHALAIVGPLPETDDFDLFFDDVRRVSMLNPAVGALLAGLVGDDTDASQRVDACLKLLTPHMILDEYGNAV